MTATGSRAANNWPLTNGDYVIGDSHSPLAVVALASDYELVSKHLLCSFPV